MLKEVIRLKWSIAYYNIIFFMFRISILVKLDMKNAFNMVRKYHILEICERRILSRHRLASLAYSSVSDLVIRDNHVQSASGVQQGDPLGPVLFSLAIGNIGSSVKSLVNIWYLNDATIGAPAASVHTDMSDAITALSAIGLEVNPFKPKIININSSNYNNDVSLIRSVHKDASATEPVDLFWGHRSIQPVADSSFTRWCSNWI